MQQISMLRYFIISINAAFGVSMATLPRAVGETAKEDMWLSVLLAGGILIFAVWADKKTAAYFPRQTCFEYNRILLGKWCGQVLNIALLIVLFLVPVVSIRSFALAVQIVLFDLTPPQVTVLILIVLLFYAGQHGLPPILRLQEFLFIPNYGLFIPLILLGFFSVEPANFTPFLSEGLQPVIKGLEPSWYAYTGPEIVIALLYPFITRQDQVLKWGAACTAVLTVINTMLVVMAQGVLGAKEAAYQFIPTIVALKQVEIPDTFIERIDGYFMLMWIPLIFTCMINWIFFTSFGAARLLRLESSRPVVVLLAPLIYCLIMTQQTFGMVAFAGLWVNRALMLWSLFIVPCLGVLAWLREGRNGKVEQ